MIALHFLIRVFIDFNTHDNLEIQNINVLRHLQITKCVSWQIIGESYVLLCEIIASSHILKGTVLKFSNKKVKINKMYCLQYFEDQFY